MVEGGMRCVKFLLFAFNFIFVLCAIGLIGAGAYVQVQFKDYFDLIGGQFSSAAALLIAVGVIIFFIAVFGCFGALKENRVCVLIFSVLLGIIFILEITGGIVGFVYRNQVKGIVEDYMKDTLKPDEKIWPKVQAEFKCCGIHSRNDWNKTATPEILASCCPSGGNCTSYPDNYFSEGCLDAFGDWVEGKIYIIGAVGIALAFIQIVGILFACCLARAIKKEYEVV